MAQLTDDCFAFGGPLMSVEAAVALIAGRLQTITTTESVPLLAADGRFLAAPLIAGISLPPFANSAVDGYAVRFADLAPDQETRLLVSGRVAAGSRLGRSVAPGEAVRIFTGAPLPEGADTVFMQEDARALDDGSVALPRGLKRGANTRLAGEDVARDAVAIRAGTRMRPQDVAMAAALGHERVSVRARPRVAVFSTGNEVVAPGGVLEHGKLYDSNRIMLQMMLTRLGCSVSDLGILPDDETILAGALKSAAQNHDLILTSGGVSTGEEDHVKAAVERVGSLVLWRLAIKPGRPVAMGVIGGAAFIGLPGNPVASFITFAQVVRLVILALSGAPVEAVSAIPVTADFSYRKKAGRREYVRVFLRMGGDGTPHAVKYPREGAGLLSSLVETQGLVELMEERLTVTPGDSVGFLPFSGLF
jgi:molybdopterin molybdotransferase